jgi:5'-3' exonuclease
MRLKLNPSKGPVLLIDTSYYVFYRYFATFNWYKRQLPQDVELNVNTIMIEPVFVEKYKKMFEKTLNDLCKLHKIESYNNVVFVKDCARDHIWRHKHINVYKATRDDKSRTFNREVFPYTYQTLLPSLQDTYKFQVFGHYSLEADDVAALVTMHLFDSYESKVVIITNDNDYIQLMTYPQASSQSSLQIRNLQGKNICERTGCSPEHYMKIKKILGDKSDNIPPITKKCGDKTAFKLALHPEQLENLFTINPQARTQYNLNELLTDFKFIPETLKQDVIAKLDVGNNI